MTPMLALLCFVVCALVPLSEGSTVLYSFEDGIEGWAGGTPPTYSGSSAQSAVYQMTTHPTLGSYCLRVAFDHQSGNTQAVFLVENLSFDFSSYATLSFDLWKSGQPPQLTVALSTGSNWVWHESIAKSIQDGSNTVTVNLKSSDWKTSATGWTNTVPIADLNAVKRIAIVFIPSSQGFNEAFIDNVRVDVASTATTAISATSAGLTTTAAITSSVATSSSSSSSSSVSTGGSTVGNLLYSFETGVDNWQGGVPPAYPGSSAQQGVYQNTAHATLGTYSLRVAFDHQSGSTQADFFVPNVTFDFSSYTSLCFDLWKSGQPPSVTVALSTGSAWLWHESSAVAIQDGSNTVTVNLRSSDWTTSSSSNIPIANINLVKQISVIFHPTAVGFNEAFIDNVRVIPAPGVTTSTITTTGKASTTTTTKLPTTTTTKLATTSTTKLASTTTTTKVASATTSTTKVSTTTTTKASTTASATTTSKASTTAGATTTSKASTTTSSSTTTGGSSGTTGFVKTSGTHFVLNGCPFYFAGTNCYYLSYKTTYMVDDVLNTAVTMGLKVIRMWAAIDIGSYPDYSRQTIDGLKDNTYYQYWNTSTGTTAYNDGLTGLAKLDYVLSSAKAKGLRLVLSLVNNWSPFGGIDQYVAWYQGQYHDDFYSNTQIRQAFKNYISHLVNRVNTVNGLVYKNDPTIFSWELTNELRCQGSGTYYYSSSCSPALLTTWVSEMSAYIKSIDSNHMVAIGDEGFYNFGSSNSDWTYSGSQGGDFNAFVAISTVDYGTFHLYTQDWGRDVPWGQTWIANHINSTNYVSKPVVMEEYGWKGSGKSSYLHSFITTAESLNIAGTHYWMLAAHQDDGTLYPDYDTYTIYNDGGADAAEIIAHAGRQNAKNSC